MKGKQFGLLLCVAILGAVALLFSHPSKILATAGINQQINYQARLLDSTGATVPDGNYNIEFKIYSGGTGCVSGGSSPCSGTLLWTEDETGSNKVVVRNGYMSVQLGAVTAFGGSVDWNNDTLWLSINIGGTGGSPSYDGEMTPFRRMTSSPYAFNSSELGGLTSSQFLQLAPGSVQTDSSTNSSVFVNKTGASGNILELQKAGVDVATLSNTGALVLQNSANSTAALQVKDTNANTVFDVDTTNGRIGVGTATPTAKLTVSDVLFSDSFTRADSTNLGSNWTERSDAGTDFQIVSNQLKLTSVDASTHALSAYTTQGISGADYSVQSDITFPSASDDWLSVFGRGSTFGTDDTQGYYAFAEMTNQRVAIWKRNAGTWTQISGNATVAISASTTYTLKLVMQGTNIYAYWNGVLVASATDSTFSSAGFGGVAVGSPYLVNSIWDNFSIVPSAASLNVNNYTAITGNGLIGIGTLTPSYALDNQIGDINTVGVYRVDGAAGSTTTCSGGQFLQNQIVNGGITVGGSCASASGSGVSTVGTFSGSSQTNGASIASSTITFGPADTTNPGMVSTGTQTFAGAKTIKVTSTAAFVVQNASAVNMFSVDTSTPAIVAGNDGAPGAMTIRGGAATGTGVAGANLTFDASNGTGSGGSGDLIFRTASAAAASPVTFDSASTFSSFSTATSYSPTFSVSSHTNRAIFVTVNEGELVTNITYNGTALTKINSTTSPGISEMWYLLVPGGLAAGSYTLAFSYSGSGSTGGIGVGFASYYNVASIGTQVTATGTAATTTTVSVTATTSQLVIDGMVTCTNTPTVTGSGQNSRYNNSSWGSVNGSDKTGVGGTTTLTWSIGGTCNYEDFAVPLNPVDSSTSDTLTDRLHITSGGNVGINDATPTTAFQVQSTSSTLLFTVDSTNTAVELGVASATPVQLFLGNKNTTDSITPGTTTCTNTGAIFYNSTDNQFRACRNGLLFNLIAGVDVQTFTASSSTWTAPSGISTVMVIACGGGGSGGGGLTGATSTARGGGSGGGGGARSELVMSAADAGSSQTVAVGQQVSGGNASSTGTAGNPTTFGGTMVVAFGGGRGNAGQATTGPSGGGGGGFGVVGGNGSTTTVAGGDNATANAQGNGGAGGGDTTAAAGKAAEWGGGGGGGSGIGTVGLAGGDSLWGGAGGGGGGGANASNVAANGASGGGGGKYASGDGVAGGSGNGATGTAGNSIHCGGGGAGGGGSAAGTGSTGGPGGAAGGGGGGGGGGITGGVGGAGAAGKVWVFSW